MKYILLLTISLFLNSNSSHALTLQPVSASEAIEQGFSEETLTQVQKQYDEHRKESKLTYTVALACAGLHAGVVINGGLNGCVGFGREGFYLIGIAFGSLYDVTLTADANIVLGFIDYERGSDASGIYESFKFSLTEGVGGTYISFEKPDHSSVLRLFGVTAGLGGEISYGTATVGVLGDDK